MGARIVSLYDRVIGKEWLLQPSKAPSRLPMYGEAFRSYGLFGWDEMFPSIYACWYPGAGRLSGTPIPDHGEVWSLPWQTLEEDDRTISLEVVGRALPYRLARRIRAGDDPKTLAFSYELTNTGNEGLFGLWAAHPQFLVEPGDTVILEDEVRTVRNARPGSELGDVDSMHSWPRTKLPGSGEIELDRVGEGPARSCRKFYVSPEQASSYAGLLRPSARGLLGLKWDSQRVPYLGVWVDEGHFSHEPVVALEPANGYMDSLENAHLRGTAMFLAPQSSLVWTILLALTDLN
jgi:hypothetical protein